jgi:GNAT superfamily N-acetyltransferase
LEAFSLRVAHSDELQALVAIDDAASEIYATAGLKLDLGDDHPFVADEKLRWARAIKQGLAQLAVNQQGVPIGFATLGFLDQEPYLDQIAVLPGYMRRGVGTMLLGRAIAWSGERPLWLTTYAHFPWNRPYYERHGFVMVQDRECGSELFGVLQEQRAALPDPDKRIAMVRRRQS